MILVDDLGINIGVRYLGKDVATCKEFISHMVSIGATKKLKSAEWILSKDYLNDIKTKYDYKIKENPWDNIGESMKLSPYPYQKEAIYYAINNPNSLLILPTGSGKTPIGVGIVSEYDNENPIIVCTKTSLKYNWLQEINKFSNIPAKIIESPSKAGKKFDEQFKDCKIFVLNYETLKNQQVYDKLREYNVCGIIMDEMQYVNNHKAKRSKATYMFNDLSLKIGLTATPITNNPLNLYGLFNMIDPTVFQSYSKFSSRYIIWKYKRPVKAKNVDEMLEKVRPFIFKKDESDIIGQLPELNVLPPIMCDMTNNMKEINDIINENLEELNNIIYKLDKKNVPETDPQWIQAQANLQAYQTYAQELADDITLLDTNNAFTKDFNIYDITNPKLDTLIEIIEPILESENKVCIFTKYERMQQKIIDAIKNTFGIEVAYVNGSMDAEERFVQAMDLFNNGDVNVIVATDAMSEGISLFNCKYLIEYEPAVSYAVQTQRRGRVKRANSASRISYIYQLVTEDSWDNISLKSINKKKGYDDSLKNL